MKEVLTARPYKAKDIEYMVQEAANIIPALPTYQGKLTFSKVRLEYLLKHNLNPQSGFGCWVLVDSQGGIHGIACGYVAPAIFSTDFVANDVFMYVKPEYRSLKHADLLVNEYVTWAQSKKAKLIIATHTSGMLDGEQLKLFDKFMARHKFALVGNVYHFGG